jgi:putative flippase GtrA
MMATQTGSASFVQFIAFVATGSLAALANLISRYFLNFLMPFELAVVLAYLVGMAVAFVLFQRVIFGNPDTPLRRRLIRFTQVNLFGLALAWLVSTLMARLVLPATGWTFHPFEIAHLLGVAAPTFSSYSSTAATRIASPAGRSHDCCFPIATRSSTGCPARPSPGGRPTASIASTAAMSSS